MGIDKKTNITISLDDEEAGALAQLCKRIGFSDVRQNSVSIEETYLMLDGINLLRVALKDAGFNPR